MKYLKIVVFFMSLIISKNYAQGSVEVDINKEIFTNNIAGMFYSEDNKAVFGAFVMPQNFEKLVSDSESLKGFGDETTTGYLKNTKVFFIKGKENRDGEEYLVYAFMKKISDTHIINMMSGFPFDQKEHYDRVVIEAAISAKIN
jgi:hypothetical protein